MFYSASTRETMQLMTGAGDFGKKIYECKNVFNAQLIIGNYGSKDFLGTIFPCTENLHMGFHIVLHL